MRSAPNNGFFSNFKIVNIVEQNIEQVKQLCRSHHVDKLYLFGSFLSGKSNDASDIDLLVRFGNVDLYHYLDNYLNLKASFESLFHKPVDLVEEQTVKNPILKSSIERSKKLIYG